MYDKADQNYLLFSDPSANARFERVAKTDRPGLVGSRYLLLKNT